MPRADRASTLGSALRAQRAVWPVSSRLLWFGVRPACTLTALVGCAIAAVDGVSVLAAVGAALLAITVRPVRRPWFDVAVAAVLLLGSPLAAVMVVARMVTGILAIRLAGGTFRRGLLVVQRGRRALTGVGRPHRTAAELRQSLHSQGTEFDVLDAVVERAVSAWTTADVRTMVRTFDYLLRGLILWRWPFPVPPSLEIRLLRIAASEHVVDRACRSAAVALAVGVAWRLGLNQPAHLFGLHIVAVVGLIPVAAAAWWSSRTDRTPLIAAPVLVVTMSAILYGWTTLLLLGLGGSAGLLVRLPRSRLQDRLLGRPATAPRLPPFCCRPAVRDQWTAARRAWSAERIWVARHLWSRLADDQRHPATVRAAAAAALAQLYLSTGSLQRAVERAEAALVLSPSTSPVRAQVCAAAGQVILAAGDTDRARDLLDDAAKSRRQRRDPLVSAARAQVLALHSDVDSALLLLNRSSGGLLRGGELDQLIDAEITVAALIARQTPLAVVAGRLDNLISYDLDESPLSDAFRKERVRTALARGRLLLGRLQLENGLATRAMTTLRIAVNGLAGTSDVADQGVARILLGAAENDSHPARGLPEVTAGVRQLESLRGQLSAGQHRGALITRHAQIYDFAFDALMRLQDHDPDGALLAAELAESLRRGALARTLREGTLDLTPEVLDLRNQIADLESSSSSRPDLDVALRQLRHKLEKALSVSFAEAYLPEPVDLPAIRRALDDAHSITFHIREFTADHVVGHVVWMPPGAGPVVTGIEITDESLLATLGTRGDEVRDDVMRQKQKLPEIIRWQKLCAALLPAGLRSALLGATDPLSLVVVPGDRLSTLPWAALRQADGRVLAESTTIQLVPTLAMLELRQDSGRSAQDIVAYLDPAVTTAAERRALRGHGSLIVDSRESLLANLSAPFFQGAYLAAHGDGLGLGQHLIFMDESTLSAGTALGLRWPRWVLFASCLVGRVPIDAGRDPLGLPVSCLLGGAQTVIGGVVEVNSTISGRICPQVVNRMLAGEHPASALRAAQLDYLRSRPDIPGPAHWAGFVCLTRISPYR